MGFNTTVLIMNDCIHGLPAEKDLGEKLHDAILGMRVWKGQVDISFGGWTNYIRVLDTHDSQYYTPILVGGNEGRVLYDVIVEEGSDKEMQLLMALAEKRGYHLRKKTQR